MIEKRRMDRFANDVVAPETKGDVGNAAAHFRVRQVGVDPTSRVDVIDRVVVMLLHARGNGEDIGIEDNVFWSKSDFINQDSVGAFADANLVLVRCSLTLFVEGHYNRRSSIFQNGRGMLAKLLLTFL